MDILSIVKEDLLSYLLNPDLKHYEDKDVIIREGAKCKDFFSLVQGTLAVMKQDKKINEITESGEFFGEMAAMTGADRCLHGLTATDEKMSFIWDTVVEEVVGKVGRVDSPLDPAPIRRCIFPTRNSISPISSCKTCLLPSNKWR